MSEFAHLATVTRASLPDTVHAGAACLVDAAGKILWAVGDPKVRAFFRSSSKPLQAFPALEAADKFGFTAAELAIICGSHEGGLPQARQVRGILEKIGLREMHLQCGEGLTDNCSGKHSGMLAACRHSGYPIEGYCAEDHPLQKRILAIVAEYCGLDPRDIRMGLDGCSAPTFNLPLQNMARAFARLAGEAGPGPVRTPAARLCRAMLDHSGGHTGEPDVRNFDVGGAPPWTKGGANGLFCAALPGPGLGFALKVADGTGQVRWPVFIAALERAGLVEAAAGRNMAEALIPKMVTRRGALTGGITVAI